MIINSNEDRLTKINLLKRNYISTSTTQTAVKVVVLQSVSLAEYFKEVKLKFESRKMKEKAAVNCAIIKFLEWVKR